MTGRGHYLSFILGAFCGAIAVGAAGLAVELVGTISAGTGSLFVPVALAISSVGLAGCGIAIAASLTPKRGSYLAGFLSTLTIVGALSYGSHTEPAEASARPDATARVITLEGQTKLPLVTAFEVAGCGGGAQTPARALTVPGASPALSYS